MKYVITGSIGHISRPLTEKLIEAGHDVTVISSNKSKSGDITALGAKAAIGTIEDVAFLKSAFAGADAVYTMIPPNFAATDWKAYIRAMGENYAEAIRHTGVKHVVNLSSAGAHLPEGCGPVSGLYFAEQALNKTGANVIHLRPGFFYYNLFSNLPLIANMGIMGGNYGNNTRLFLVDPKDIAASAAEELLYLRFSRTTHRYIAGDERTTDEIAAALGTAIGKAQIPWVQFTDEQAFEGMKQAGLSPEIARNYVEMGTAIQSGALFGDMRKSSFTTTGKIKLQDFAKEFAQVYSKSQLQSSGA